MSGAHQCVRVCLCVSHVCGVRQRPVHRVRVLGGGLHSSANTGSHVGWRVHLGAGSRRWRRCPSAVGTGECGPELAGAGGYCVQADRACGGVGRPLNPRVGPDSGASGP